MDLLFVCFYTVYLTTSLDFVRKNGNWYSEESGCDRLYPKLYPYSLVELRETMRTSIRKTDVTFDIRTSHFPNAGNERLPLKSTVCVAGLNKINLLCVVMYIPTPVFHFFTRNIKYT